MNLENQIVLTKMDRELIENLIRDGKTILTFNLEIPLSKGEIDKIFENKQMKGQWEYWLALWKKAFPNGIWKLIDKIGIGIIHYPKVSEETNRYIMGKAIQWDSENIPKKNRVMSGGLWMDSGFSQTYPKLQTEQDWMIYLKDLKVRFKPIP